MSITNEFNAMASAGDTPLMKAIEASDLPGVKRLVEEQGADVNETNAIRSGPMHYAASHGETEIARYLKEKGADINAQNSTGATPFFLAVINSRVKTATTLILLGADKSIRGHQDQTPYERAQSVGLQKNVDQIEAAISRHHANRAKIAMKKKR